MTQSQANTPPALAAPGDPLVARNGRVVPADGTRSRGKINLVDLPPDEFRPQAKRALGELPTDAKAMRAVAVIYVFTMLGVSDQEIADEIGITAQEVREFRKQKAYYETFEAVQDELIDYNAGSLKGRIAAYAHTATERIAGLMDSDSEGIVLASSRDILDRAGVKHADEVKQASQNELRITVVKKDDSVQVDVGIN